MSFIISMYTCTCLRETYQNRGYRGDIGARRTGVHALFRVFITKVTTNAFKLCDVTTFGNGEELVD